MNTLKGETCPLCGNKTLTLTESNENIPYFGKVYLYSMKCENSECNYEKSDVESESRKDPVKITITIDRKEDINIRVIKSSEATLKIPQLRMSVTPGPDSQGYISNVEGVLDRFKKVIEVERDASEEPDVKKSAKNLLKKLWKIKLGEIPIKIIVEDPSGNSAVISKKAEVQKLK